MQGTSEGSSHGEDRVPQGGGVLSTSQSLHAQGIRFLISGVISAVVDLGLTSIFQYAFGWSPGSARTVGFIFGTLTAYVINRRWTFRATPSTRRFLAVCVLYALTYVINYGLYTYGFILLVGWGFPPALATLCAFVVAQGVATITNFIVQRVWIFKISS